MEWLDRLRDWFECEQVYYTQHARFEMEHEEFGRIRDAEVFEAVCTGEVIAEYPEDRPYPSILVYGLTQANRPLHLVCALDEEGGQAIVITVYEPDPERWVEYRERKRS